MTWLLNDIDVTCNGEQVEQLTVWGEPDARMGGVRGRPTYEKWLIAEKKRIKEDNLREAKIVKHPKRGFVSLWVDHRCAESIQNSYQKIADGLLSFYLRS